MSRNRGNRGGPPHRGNRGGPPHNIVPPTIDPNDRQGTVTPEIVEALATKSQGLVPGAGAIASMEKMSAAMQQAWKVLDGFDEDSDPRPAVLQIGQQLTAALSKLQ